MSSSYRLELDRWLANLDVKAETVVDIGGSQLNVKGRTKGWDVKDYQVWDLAKPHADSAKPDKIFDIEWELEQLPNEGDTLGLADVIFCLEVFDYIIDPVTAFENIWWALKPAGVAYISFPFIYPTHQPVEHEGLRYTENSIYRLAKFTGLDVVELIPRRPKTILLNEFYQAEGMRAARGYNHAVTGWIGTFRRAG